MEVDVKGLSMKIQYKNRTYKQTNWPCCDCELAKWQVKSFCYYVDCPPLVKLNCCEHAFKRKSFNDKIFKLENSITKSNI